MSIFFHEKRKLTTSDQEMRIADKITRLQEHVFIPPIIFLCKGRNTDKIKNVYRDIFPHNRACSILFRCGNVYVIELLWW